MSRSLCLSETLALTVNISGTAGCVGHGSARALRLVGPVYHDCRPEWDNQITHFDCKPI